MKPAELDEDFVEAEEIGPATTLEEFLGLPEIEDSPAWEFVDGRMVRKAMPGRKHNSLARFFLDRLNGFAEPRGLGEALTEQRCNFGGRSIVPDVVFELEARTEYDQLGDPTDVILQTPDVMIEIISPRQSVSDADDKLRHAMAHGCPLGWLTHPYRETITVYRPGAEPVTLGLDGILEGAPVLPGFRLPVAEVFAWLKRRRRDGGA